MPSNLTEAYVWFWLPEATEPVVAGKLSREGAKLIFNYGQSYLAREGAIPIYLPELPLEAGALPLLDGLQMPSCLRDAAPDAWGRRVILNKVSSRKIGGGPNANNELDELTYLLESGSDRIGALDFQTSATEYRPRGTSQDRQAATLEELLASAERVEQGVPLTEELDMAIQHGTSIGGARPKVLIEGSSFESGANSHNQPGKKFIAKFSSSADTYSMVKAEYIAMRLARECGLNVAEVSLVQASGKDVLLIERFDRKQTNAGWTRKPMVSALTLLGLDEMMASYASYEDLAEIIRHRFDNPKDTLKELYGRIVFNILSGNNDDHARNHAAFWDGEHLELTPAYDICPQARTGQIATQAMLISGNNRESKISACLAAANNFLLDHQEARDIVDHQKTVIHASWDNVCEEAKLSAVDKNLFWERQFLNPYAFEDGE